MDYSNENLSSSYLEPSESLDKKSEGSTLLRLFRDRKSLVENILSGHDVKNLLVVLVSWSIFLLALYGFSMGLYANALQAFYSAVKMPIVFLGTLTLCFPPLYLLSVLVGLEIGFFKTLSLALLALTMGSLFLCLLTPVSLLFTLSDSSREILSLIHVLTVGSACLVMVAFLGRVFSDVSESTMLYPPHIRRVLCVWVVLLAFVGGQVAWLLLPFLGDRARETEFLRDEKTNATLYRELNNNLNRVWNSF